MKTLLNIELLIMSVAMPWVVWITISAFHSQSVDAVQETKYDYIIETLKEIKESVKKIGEKNGIHE